MLAEPPAHSTVTSILSFWGGLVCQFLLTYHIPICGEPLGCQSQNGLVENHWHVLVHMVHSYLANMHMPKKLWVFAVKWVCCICNYPPVTVCGTLTTPFELVHHQKPNYR